MAFDLVDSTFSVATRDQVRDGLLKSYRFRVPAADTSAGTQPFVDASNAADALAPLYYDAQLIAAATSIYGAVKAQLDVWGARYKVPRKGVTKSSGYVGIGASVGGGTIYANTELKLVSSGLKLRTTVTGVYQDGAKVAVQSVDGGPQVNVKAGTQLQFTSPPPGIQQSCIVFKDTNGDGLKGGADVELDDPYRRRILETIQNPPAAGNVSEVIRVVEEIADLAVQKCFAVPAITGPGTTSVIILTPPDSLGGSRIPNGAQLAEVQAELQSAFPGDDGYYVCSVAEQALVPVVGVTWLQTAPGWVDASPWPLRTVSVLPHVSGSETTAGTFNVTLDASLPAPVAGQSIGLWDFGNAVFVRKLITSSTFVSSGIYTLTLDTSSPFPVDTTFAPNAGTIVSPWSDSLNGIVPPILTYVDATGPGELVASFPDPGRRQRRYPPPSPSAYPNEIDNSITIGLYQFCSNVELLAPSTPCVLPVGNPLLAYVFRVADIGVYPS